MPLVLLEACRGAQVSELPVFGAVAPALLQSGVGSVIAFSHSVHAAAASLLCERLYCELAAGTSIGEAFEDARAALFANHARWLAQFLLRDTSNRFRYNVGHGIIFTNQTLQRSRVRRVPLKKFGYGLVFFMGRWSPYRIS